LGARVAGGLTLGLLLGAQLTLATMHALTASEDRNTTYFYRETGQREAGAWLRDTLSIGTVVVADREVSYYAALGGGAPPGFPRFGAPALHAVDAERLLYGSWEEVSALAGRPSAIVSRHAGIAAQLPPGARRAGEFGRYTAWICCAA